MPSDPHRNVLLLDYEEAQRAFYSGAYKLSTIGSGGLIEAMLMDAIQWPAVEQLPNFGRATKDFPTRNGSVIWDRVSLAQLIKAAEVLGLLDDRVLGMAGAARDFRDTVHPNREVGLGARAGQQEAKLFLALVPLIHRDLAAYAARAAASQSTQQDVSTTGPSNG